MNSYSPKRGKFIRIALIVSVGIVVLFVGIVSYSQMLSELPKKGLLMTTNQNYETEIGTLKGDAIILNGNRMDLKNGQIISAIMYVGSEQAFKIKSEIKISDLAKGKSCSLTLLQDKNNKEWLATNGWLGIINNETYIIDNCQLKILGGEKNPITIDGKTYSNTELRVNK
jgi:hypothetical protein